MPLTHIFHFFGLIRAWGGSLLEEIRYIQKKNLIEQLLALGAGLNGELELRVHRCDAHIDLNCTLNRYY
jgi:hypothetical protein